MNALYVVAVLVAVAHCGASASLPSSDQERMAAVNRECMQELGLKEEDVGPTNFKLMYCRLEKEGSIVGGKFSGNPMIERVEKTHSHDPKFIEAVKNSVNMCRAELESSDAMGEELAKKIIECLQKYEPMKTDTTTSKGPM